MSKLLRAVLVACLISLPNMVRASDAPNLEAQFNFFTQDYGQRFASWNLDLGNVLDLFGASAVDEALNDPRLYSVTKEYGQMVINTSRLPFRSETVSAERRAWSSWWFPIFEPTMFKVESGDSPLEKYDDYREEVESPGLFGPSLPSAAKWEEQNRYDPSAQRWEGLCDAWALAATVHPEPVRPVEKNGVKFSVGDLKALLLKTFEGVDPSSLKFYGVRFEGNKNSWVFPDIFPDQFHQFVEQQLFRSKRGFVMDHDAGVPVWNVPVYKANYYMEQDPANANRVIVRMWLYYADQLGNRNLRETVGTKEFTREYNYALSGKRNSQGNLVIEEGEWLQGKFQDSRGDHPDFLIAVPSLENVKRASKNPEVKVKLVDDILKGSY